MIFDLPGGLWKAIVEICAVLAEIVASMSDNNPKDAVYEAFPKEGRFFPCVEDIGDLEWGCFVECGIKVLELHILLCCLVQRPDGSTCSTFNSILKFNLALYPSDNNHDT